jgi:hypothetical protein
MATADCLLSLGVDVAMPVVSATGTVNYVFADVETHQQ